MPTAPAVTLRLPPPPEAPGVLTPEALAFVGDLVRAFAPRRDALLAARRAAQARFDAGEAPDFLPETADVREGAWTVAPAPADLTDRRVEITGPVDRKMVINALNSGARVFMADFEDATAPTWANVVAGQRNLIDAVRRTISHVAPETGKAYALSDRPATLVVRPRGWHLDERHVLVDGRAAPGALVDFGLYFFHNARELVARSSGPYFYLPKLEHHAEAALWDDVFVRAQERLGLPVGTVRATVLIETLPAAFQMHEILHALRRHAAGLNCGRWDYIFSAIKTLGRRADWVTPDRGQVRMTQPFMRAYTQLLIQTCHRRGAHAIGGMAAQIPIKGDPEANERALAAVRADKEREADDGHDGTWVAHPGLVPVAQAAFDARMPGPHQLARLREDVRADRAALLAPPAGTRTAAGLRQNVAVGVRYLEAWLRGQGCVPIDHLMEDAATAEISRAQLWQWVRHAAPLDDGRPVTLALVEAELARLEAEVGPAWAQGAWAPAAGLFRDLVARADLAPFLTLPAYDLLVADPA